MYDKSNTLEAKEIRFNNFINKIIIFSSKKYYKEIVTKDLKELKIIDDKNYEEHLKEFVKYEDDEVYNHEDVDEFVNHCDNELLVCALKSLSDIEMMVIFLLFEKQFSSQESSKILKICSDSVTRIKRRALKKIETYLKGRN